MQLTNSATGYGLIQIGLHWASVLFVAVLIPLGLWMTGLDYYDPWYWKAPDMHRALGVLFAVLLLARFASRLLQTAPAPLSPVRLHANAARWTHRALYLLPALSVLSGYLVSTADGRPVEVFGLFSVPATLQGLDRQADIAGEIHFAVAMVLLAVIALHVGAALYHHLVLGDATLRRIFRSEIGQRQ